MGTYTDFTVAGYPLILSKSEVVAEAMTVFRETDRRTFERRVSQRNRLVWGAPELSEPDDDETVVDYACQTSKVMDRLNIMGFTIDRVRTEFEQCRREELEVNGAEVVSDDDDKHIAFLRGLTFDRYAEAFSQILRCGYLAYRFDEYKSLGLDPIVTYILDYEDEYPFGFFCADIRCLIRLACDLSEPGSLVVQDISDLVSGGYYEEREPVCEDCVRALIAGHPENAPRIILTEGSSDRSALEAAMTFLYPHLSQYYSFLDFESTRSPGGAPHLVAMVKAFAAAGITNRLIALFDNDTAAKDARRALSQVSLPNNIAVLNYPDLAWLQNYPTIGPTGLTEMNVNGLAASIELYLGEDVLLDESGVLRPVQWKGYNDTLNQYQGEVMGKAKIHAAFDRKIRSAKTAPTEAERLDWKGLRAILSQVFRAFEPQN